MSFIDRDRLRNSFTEAMSDMYQSEVPQYGLLLDIVASVNLQEMTANPNKVAQVERAYSCGRIAKERHGAIRIGKAEELNNLRRLFALLGMFPVGYYDLGVAGIPVHSTAFRPLSNSALSSNPFRIFTSLLRVDLIDEPKLRQHAENQLRRRTIFSPRLMALIEQAESQGGMPAHGEQEFIKEALEVFRWHDKAMVDADLYKELLASHGLIADIVSFKGPHINHLTPATLNIDTVQTKMPSRGIEAKAVIEGPPMRQCPILLRQTSFKALSETIYFPNPRSGFDAGTHTARFGEIEQRGIALTPKGMALYNKLLMAVRSTILPKPDGSNAREYTAALMAGFEEFPDSYQELREADLAYFKYSVVDKNHSNSSRSLKSLNDLIAGGYIRYDPIIYEDFLPVSAAGIFQSNLASSKKNQFTDNKSNQVEFEKALGAPVSDPFELYQSLQDSSIEECMKYFTR